ncbi:hypothetical protein LEN26_013552 [Aphanomyces euteiches]|nr:hypothetical protein AeMF1_015505 [Aphanomyces euteiches]KAH9111084.1 hypothetical protein LEN26_013552 [Aphanomyces euteiches]KAH9193942.1 hypothetical protein AeNC1_004072 [Aphanomyces euteiches]
MMLPQRLLVPLALAVAVFANYYKPTPAPAPAPGYSSGYDDYDDDDYSPPSLPPPKKVRFKAPFKAFDPNHHTAVFAHFRSCASVCTKNDDYTPYASNSDAWAALAAIGSYSACVSSCVAHEILQLVTYYKSTYAKLLDITENQLRLARGYIAGTTDFDLIGNRTHVGYSCCLPDYYFVPWSKITIPVPIYFQDQARYVPEAPLDESPSSTSAPAYVRADTYLKYCNNVGDGDDDNVDWNAIDDGNGIGGLKISCDHDLVAYLTEVKQGLGQSILHPYYAQSVPDGACTKRANCNVNLKPNPKGVSLPPYVCVAEKTLAYYASNRGLFSENKEDDASYLTELVYKEVNSDTGNCDPLTFLSNPSDNSTWLTITFKKISSKHIDVYTVINLPRSNYDYYCDLSYNVSITKLPNSTDLTCLRYIDTAEYWSIWGKYYYHHGAVEYCNAKQYVNHLQFHATYTGTCEGYEDVVDVQTLKQQYITGSAQVPGRPYWDETYSIACLYRIFSLKCDCMQAVLNCYTQYAHYSGIVGKTLGRATSILCGFVLCQKESVYKLFMNAQGLSHTQILAEVLLQATGQLESSAWNPASTAFLSFAAGMLAFVAAKQLAPRAKSTMEDGYANLI